MISTVCVFVQIQFSLRQRQRHTISSSPSFKVRDMLLFKLSVRHPYWPVQVSSVDGEIINVTYYGTGQSSTITNPGRAALLAFNEKVIKDLKLDENPKLKTALKKARDALM